MRRLATAALVLALLAAGCGADGRSGDDATQEPAPSATTTGPEPGDATTTGADPTATCTNDEDGYAIDYPEGWWANSEVAAPCSYFHPEPVELVEATEAPPTAVRVSREPAPFDEIVREQIGREILTRDETTVAGRDAVRMEVEFTGEALAPAGVRGYQYVVDLGGGDVLILTTQEADDLDYERNKDVLDEMVETLELPAAD